MKTLSDDIITNYHEWILNKRKVNLFEKIYFRIFGLPVLGKKLRLDIIKKYIKDDKNKINHVLDLGCGLGEMSLLLAQCGKKVTSVDISKKNLTLLNEFSKKLKYPLKTITSNLEAKNSWHRETYSLIICLAVLDYLNEPYKLLSKLDSLLKPNGIIYLGFPLLSRKIDKDYEHIAKAITKSKGFDENYIINLLKKQKIILRNQSYYMPLNLFYYMSRTVSFLRKFNINYERSLALLYPIFIFIIVVLRIFTQKGTEIIIKFQKE